MVDHETEGAFLVGGGEIGRQVAEFPWESTVLGPIATWPHSLRTAVSLVLNSTFPMYLAWGPRLISFYNEAYRPILGGQPEALGRPFPEVWAQTWDIFGPITDAALKGHASFYRDMPVQLSRNGRLEDTWWTFSYSPVRDESGAVGGVLCVVQETTSEVQTRDRLAAERSYLEGLLRQAPSMVAVLNGPDHVFEIANEAYRTMMGPRDLIGRAAREALPEVASQGFIDKLDEVYRTGRPFIGAGVPFQRPASDVRPPEDRFLDFIYQPIFDHQGEVTGIFVDGIDVTERKRAEDQQKLLLDELNHRVKNTLATVQSIALQTLRTSSSPALFRERFETRLLALARAHDLLSRRAWEGADISDVVRLSLEPFAAGAASRFELRGSFHRLSPTQSLAISLALHELATNALKHGALSSEAGSVAVAWFVRPDAGGRTLVLNWTERGGPPVKEPETTGFGMRLLQTGLKRELAAQVTTRFAPSGLECDLEIPVA